MATVRLAPPAPIEGVVANTMTHRKGEVVMFTTGDYSDYSVRGVMRAVCDIDLGYLAAMYYQQAPISDKPWSRGQRVVNASGFMAWLQCNGYAVEIDYDELNVDDCYGRFSQEVEEAVRARRTTKE